MLVKKIEQFELRVGGQIVWTLENRTGPAQATVTMPADSEKRNPLIAEGVRRAVGEYVEVMRKLSNE